MCGLNSNRHTTHRDTLHTETHYTQRHTTHRDTLHTETHYTQRHTTHRDTLHTGTHYTQGHTTHRDTLHTHGDRHTTQRDRYTTHTLYMPHGQMLHTYKQPDIPKADSFSNTITLNDGRRVSSSRAVARPTIPPPTTATSYAVLLL